jgi:hypothetical protein
MTPALTMTKTQERRIYRDAVLACLEAFYGKSKPEATRLVRAWWTRLSETKAFESGMFLHAEPLHTAANIAGVRAVAITGQNRAGYHSILDRSRDLVLSKITSLPSPAQLRRWETEKRKQLLHFASPEASESLRITALQTVPKKVREKKSTQEQQIAYR